MSPLAQHVARLVPHAGLQAGVGDHVEAERVAIEVGGLPRIAHEHPHVVDALERHRVVDHAVASGASARRAARRQPITPRTPVVLQAVPEHGDGVEDFVRALEEPRLVEPRGEEDVFELFHGVAGVLGLDAVVPGEEGDFEARAAGSP